MLLREPTFSDQTAGTVDTSWVELDEFQVLEGKACASNHGITVARARVRTRAAEVSASITTSRQDGLVCTETVKSTVFHIQRNNTDALAILHDQVKSKVLDEEVGVVTEGLAVEGVEEGVAGTVGRGGATVSLATLAELEGLTTERTLVDLALLRS